MTFTLQPVNLATLSPTARAEYLYALGDREPPRSDARARYYAEAAACAEAARLAAARATRAQERRAQREADRLAWLKRYSAVA
jgi:hypothetical protein